MFDAMPYHSNTYKEENKMQIQLSPKEIYRPINPTNKTSKTLAGWEWAPEVEAMAAKKECLDRPYQPHPLKPLRF